MEKPILFNTAMVRALLDGRKTETRRIAKTNNRGLLIKPYEVGDLLWVRETWAFCPCITCGEPCVNSSIYSNPMYGKTPETMETADGLTEGCFRYRADGKAPVFPGGHIWRPSIHMPRQAARIFLRVTGVTWQEIQKITDREARAEGCGELFDGCKVSIAREAFVDLWDSTIPKGRLARDGWEANPLVCVIRFERAEKPKRWPE